MALSDIGRRYLSRALPTTESELSNRLGVPLAQLERVLDKCVRRGLILRTAEPAGITLARTPESISAAEMLEAVRGELIVPTRTGRGVAELLRTRDEALSEGLEGITLQYLIRETLDDVTPKEEFEETRKDH